MKALFRASERSGASPPLAGAVLFPAAFALAALCLAPFAAAAVPAEALRVAAWDDPEPATRDSVAKPGPRAAPARPAWPVALPPDSASPIGIDTFPSDPPRPGEPGAMPPGGAVPTRAEAPRTRTILSDETLSDLDAGTALILLPTSALRGADTGALAQAAAGLRLGLAESGRFRILTREEAAQAWPGGRLPGPCFAPRCLARAAGAAPVPLVLASDFALREGRWVMRLALAQSPDGRIRRALQVWAPAATGGPIAFAREAGLRLATPDAQGPAVAGALFASGPWRGIAWLNPADSIDLRARAGWGGAGLLAAAAALAYAEGQLTGADGNGTAPARALRPLRGEYSYLRGFFASPVLGARYAGMGGAGLAAVDDGMALLMNPAGAAGADREDAIMAKRGLPDGTPSFFVAYAGPSFRGWHQGLGARFEGDRLANEATAYGTLACDLGAAIGPGWEGVRAGASAKLYLAQAGEAGTGLDRSTGHSYGMGFDLGVQAPLGERLTAALSVRDAFGFLRHANTFTDRAYGETLPMEWKLGSAYRAGGGLILLLDGQKGIWADQADHLRAGGEQVLWDVLALRGGLHETFGRETVRALALGFGLDSGGLKDGLLKVRLILDYAYEFGLGADAPLAGGQQFSLRLGF